MIALVAVAPTFAGYVRAPASARFTGAPTYADDAAQHEVWADQMSHHLRNRNLLTPEPTRRGWFVSPYDLTLGLAQRATGLDYAVLGAIASLLAAPLLALALMALARRAGIEDRHAAAAVAVVALLAGTWAPLLAATGIGDTARHIGGEATPVFAGQLVYVTLAALVLVALSEGRFRGAGLALLLMGALYPFFVPALWLTGALFVALRIRESRRRSAAGASSTSSSSCSCRLIGSPGYHSAGTNEAVAVAVAVGVGVGVRDLAWFVGLSLPPMLYYAVLPHVDAEFAHFSSANHLSLLSPPTVVLSLGLGVAAYVGLPRLWRGPSGAQVLGCLAVAVLVALYVPSQPWRSHLFYLSPFLVVGAAAAWWPLRSRAGWVVRIGVGGAVVASLVALPYYDRRNIDGVRHARPPAYLTVGDVRLLSWLAHHGGDAVVLTRSDISPWVAARGRHRVVVGHYLWTRDYEHRRAEVDRAFDDGSRADAADLVRTLHVAYVLVDGERGTPPWAAGLPVVTHAGDAVLLRPTGLA